MAYKRTPTRTRRSFKAAFRTPKFALTAAYAAEQTYRDGEDANATGVSPVVNTTNSLLLAAYGDFAAATPSGYVKNPPRIKRVLFQARINPTEAMNQATNITWQWWFMLATGAVNTDWITNGRDPNDAALALTSAAFPHTILKTGFTQTVNQSADDTQPDFPAVIRADLKYRGLGLKLKFPFNLYFCIKPIIENDAAGTLSAQEVAITWNVMIRARNSLEA